MNKSVLLSGVAMSPVERQMGRFMRAPDGHDDSGTGGGGAPSGSGTGENNSNVIPGGGENNSQTPNNSGGELELETFWNNDDDTSGDDGGDPAVESKRLGGEIGQAIEQFAPPPVFTKELADQIADGNLEGINAAMAKAHQETIKQSVQLTARLVGAVMDRMNRDFDARIEQGFGKRDETTFLESKFPIAKDPTHAPMVRRVWDQAIKNSKGDRAKAERLTRGMLDAFGSAAAPDSIRRPADDPTHGINTAASRSLVEQLLGRDD